MKFTLSFRVPGWLLPKRLRDDLDRRSKLTGKASVSREWPRSRP